MRSNSSKFYNSKNGLKITELNLREIDKMKDRSSYSFHEVQWENISIAWEQMSVEDEVENELQKMADDLDEYKADKEIYHGLDLFINNFFIVKFQPKLPHKHIKYIKLDTRINRWCLDIIFYNHEEPMSMHRNELAEYITSNMLGTNERDVFSTMANVAHDELRVGIATPPEYRVNAEFDLINFKKTLNELVDMGLIPKELLGSFIKLRNEFQQKYSNVLYEKLSLETPFNLKIVRLDSLCRYTIFNSSEQFHLSQATFDSHPEGVMERLKASGLDLKKIIQEEHQLSTNTGSSANSGNEEVCNGENINTI